MLSAAASIGLLVVFVLPGFVIADLAESRRATRPARTGLELILRGLAYALLLQATIVMTGWTGSIVDDLESQRGWQGHLEELAAFALVAGVALPISLGLLLSWWLRGAEARGPLRAWHYAMGARDHREAWDFVFSELDGAFLLLTLTEAGGSRQVLARYGPRSWASQAPTRPQELYVEAAWPSDANGFVDEADLSRSPRGLWVSAEKLDRIEIIQSGQVSDVS